MPHAEINCRAPTVNITRGNLAWVYVTISKSLRIFNISQSLQSVFVSLLEPDHQLQYLMLW